MASGSQRGCVLICEPDPPPGALLGRMAFGGFNPEAEKLQVFDLNHAITSVTCVNPVALVIVRFIIFCFSCVSLRLDIQFEFVLTVTQKEAEGRLEAAKAGKSDTPIVSDLEMARNLGQKEDKVSSMRMQKKKVRRK